MREGLAVTATGLLVGLTGAAALARLLERLLFGVTPRDVASFALVPAVLLPVAAAACLLPAWRAARADPARGLRCERADPGRAVDGLPADRALRDRGGPAHRGPGGDRRVVDWMCFPRFDSPSVFAAILDDTRGGRFRIAPAGEGLRHKQYYWPETNVLVTRFLSPDGVGQVVDYMPAGLPADAPGRHQLVRRVQTVRGVLRYRLVCAPAFDYGRQPHVTRRDADGASFESPLLSLGLRTSHELRVEGPGGE